MQQRLAIVLLLVLLAAAAAGLWYWRQPAAVQSPAPVVAEEPVAEEAAVARPRYPMPAPAPERDRPNLRPLPALDDSDEYFKLELVDLLGEGAAERLASSTLIERVVATIDNLPRQRIAERLRPVAPPDGKFEVDGQDGSGEFQLSGDNFSRYDAAVAQFGNIDPQQALDLYQRFYPLFQKAYEGLGYPDGYFNDRLVEVIDHLLATPDVRRPILLTRPHVLYRYADDELESLSAGQKLLIRIGPQHRATVLARLRELRPLLADATGR